MARANLPRSARVIQATFHLNSALAGACKRSIAQGGRINQKDETRSTGKPIERSDQEVIEINIEKIPPEEIKAMARCLLTSMTDFYSDPENQRKYLEWKEQRKPA